MGYQGYGDMGRPITPQERVLPGFVVFGLAGFIILAGIAMFVVFLVSRIEGMTDQLTRFVAPGSVDLELAEPGTYTIFHEYRSDFEGKVYSSPANLGGMSCTVTSMADESQIPLRPVSSNMTYNMGSRSGYGVLSFDVDNPGGYKLQCSYAGPDAVLAVGRGFVEGILYTVFMGMAILGGPILLGIAIILFAVLRNVKRRNASMVSGPPPSPY